MVLAAIVDLATRRSWTLLATHIRQTHVHPILVCDTRVDRAMSACKAAATKNLNLEDSDLARRRWAQGGNVLLLRTPKAVTDAIHYVVRGQGEPMSLFPLKCGLAAAFVGRDPVTAFPACDSWPGNYFTLPKRR